MGWALYYIWAILQIAIGYNLFVPLLLLALYHLSFRRQTKTSFSQSETDYGIIITAYEQTTLLPAAVKSLLNLNYSNFLIYVVADNCDISDLSFDDKRVKLLRPKDIIASNTGSILYAINHFERKHERFTVIDSDNLVHPNFLTELNIFFDQGFEAVQGLRMAKNLDSAYSCLDAARDIYYHFYDGKILFGSGSSATLSGSGMAFTIQLYDKCLRELNVQGAGFDKVWQAQIVSNNFRIAFAENAIVYDEKTSGSEQLRSQRSRWINSWFSYFRYGFGLVYQGLSEASRNQFIFGFIILRPPLFIFLSLSVLALAINIFLNPLFAILWAIGLICFVSGFIYALVKSKTDQRIWTALLSIPKFVYFQFLALLSIRSSSKNSIATKHSKVLQIEDISIVTESKTKNNIDV